MRMPKPVMAWGAEAWATDAMLHEEDDPITIEIGLFTTEKAAEAAGKEWMEASQPRHLHADDDDQCAWTYGVYEVQLNNLHEPWVCPRLIES